MERGQIDGQANAPLKHYTKVPDLKDHPIEKLLRAHKKGWVSPADLAAAQREAFVAGVKWWGREEKAKREAARRYPGEG